MTPSSPALPAFMQAPCPCWNCRTASLSGPVQKRLAADNSPAVQAALLAVEVCVWGLSALQNTTAALDLFEQVITPHLKREDAIRPVEPDTPKMLPSVHVMWGFLVTALQVLNCCSSPQCISMQGRHRPFIDQCVQLPSGRSS